MLKRSAAFLVVYVSLLSFAAQAQNVFVLPGPGSTTASVLPFSNAYVAINTGFTAGAGAFAVFAKPDGTEYYVVSASATQTVTSVDAGFQNPKSLANLGAPATAAGLTADGKYLLVVAGGALYIFTTANDTQVNSAGILPPGGPIADLALSVDGSQAFVLSTTLDSAGLAQGTVYSVNPSNGQLLANLVIDNILTNVTVGPNDLVYVSGTNRFYEINPATMVLTSSGEISLNASAGKPGFTPDGHYALVPNQSPGQNGSALVVIDLIAHSVVTVGSNLGNTILNTMFVPNNTTAFAYSSDTASVYQFTIPNLNTSGINFAGVPSLNVTAAAISSEAAEGANAVPAAVASSPKTAHYLYVLASSNLYRVDLTTNQLSGQVPVSIQQPQAIATAGPAITGTSPVTLLVYGNKQSVALGGVSEPLVVRALDANGNGLSGVPVTFATTSAGAQIKTPSTTTGATGYAATTITVPSTTNEQITVTAAAGSQSAAFGITVGTLSIGGSGGTQAGSLTVVSGQGQVFLAGFGSSTGNGLPLTVMATDANNKPLSGVKVTFEPQTNNLNANPGAAGSLIGASVGTDGGATPDGFGRYVTTGANGLAGVNFQANSEVNFSLIQSSFIASAANINSVTFYVTVAPATGSPAVRSSVLPGATITGQSGATLPGAISIAIATEQGTPIPDVLIQAIETPASVGQTGPLGSNRTITPSPVVTCADTTGNGVLTGQTGVATCNLVIMASQGTYQFSINVGNYIVQGPYNIKVLPSAPSAVQIISGNNQTGAPGQTLALPFVVQVNDAGGNPLANQAVTFQASTDNTLVLSSISTATDMNGRASAIGTLGSNSGTYQLQVTAGGSGGPSATFSYTVSVPISGIQIVSGNSQTVAESTAFPAPLIVQVNNANGPVAGVTVTFSVSNGAVLSTSSVPTGANGQASTFVTAGPAPGTITVSASAPGGFTTSFSLTAIPPGASNVTFLNGASFQPGISPGAIAVINGTGLLPGFSGLFNTAGIVGPLPTSITTGALAGLSITFNGVAAPIYYASSQNGMEQVAIQVPFETSPGMVSVVISSPGGGTATLNVPVQAAAPGVFQTEYNGMSFAVAIRESDGSYISPSNPAQIGDTICVFATGLGQTTPALTTGSNGVADATLVYPIDVGLNNAGVRLVSASPSPYQVGVFTVCMEVPAGITTGPRQPFGIVVHTSPGVSSGDYFGNSTYIPIQ